MKFKSYKLYAILLVTTLFYIWIYQSPYIDYVDNKVYDFFSKKFDFNKEKKATLTPSVVIVEIDKKSVDKLGQWPWSRIITANLINKVNQAHPSTVGLNIMFRQQDKNSIVAIQKFYKTYMDCDVKVSGLDEKFFDNDEIFIKSLISTKTILPVYLQKTKTTNSYIPQNLYSSRLKEAQTTYEAASVLCNIKPFHEASYAFGFINATLDKDGTLRRTPLFSRYKDDIITAFSLVNLLAIDKNIKFSDSLKINILGHTFHTNKASEVLLSFYDKNWYKHISAIDVLEDRVDKKLLAGKIVLIGTSLLGATNEHRVTTGETLNGTDISATVIENILNDQLLYQPDIFKYTNIILSFLFSLAAIFILRKNRYFILSMFYIGAFTLSLAISLLAFKNGIYTSIAYAWLPLLIHFAFLGFVVLYIYNQDQKKYYQELSHSHSAALDSMVLVAATKDFETGAHLTRTKEYMKLLARYLKSNGVYKNILSEEFIEIIYHAAPLHDIGKVGIPDAILQKPGKLDEKEFDTMKKHPKLGMEIISNAMNSYSKNDFLKAAYNITYYHHEKWDGSGYPIGLKKSKIPLEARLMALVDVYDALISKRCYKDAFSYEKAEEIIIQERAKHFDPKIVDAFIELKDAFKEIAENNR